MRKNYYSFATSVAWRIKIGVTSNYQNSLNAIVANRLPFEELVQIIDVAYFESELTDKPFYQLINKALYHESKYLPVPAELKDNISSVEIDEQPKLKSLYFLYRVIGKSNFIKIYCPYNVSKNTFRKWCDAAFRHVGRNGKGERVHPNKKDVLNALREGGEMRFTERGSVYITLIKEKIRISDHETSIEEDVTLNIIIK